MSGEMEETDLAEHNDDARNNLCRGDLGLCINLDIEDIEEEIELEWDFYLPLSTDDDFSWDNYSFENLYKSDECYKFQYSDKIESHIKKIALNLNTRDGDDLMVKKVKSDDNCANDGETEISPCNSIHSCVSFWSAKSDNEAIDQQKQHYTFQLSNRARCIVRELCTTYAHSIQNNNDENTDQIKDTNSKNQFKIINEKRKVAKKADIKVTIESAEESSKLFTNKGKTTDGGSDTIDFCLRWLNGGLIYDPIDPGVNDLSFSSSATRNLRDEEVDSSNSDLYMSGKTQLSLSDNSSCLSFISACSSSSSDGKQIQSFRISGRVDPHSYTKFYQISFIKAEELEEYEHQVAPVKESKEVYNTFASTMSQSIMADSLSQVADIYSEEKELKEKSKIQNYVEDIFTSVKYDLTPESEIESKNSKTANLEEENQPLWKSETSLLDLNEQDSISEVSLGKDIPVIHSSVCILRPEEIIITESGHEEEEEEEDAETEDTDDFIQEYADNLSTSIIADALRENRHRFAPGQGAPFPRSVVREDGDSGGTRIFFRTVDQPQDQSRILRYVDGIIDHAIQRTIDEVGNHIAQQAEHTHSGNPQPTELILLKGPTYEEIIVPTEVGIEEQSEGISQSGQVMNTDASLGQKPNRSDEEDNSPVLNIRQSIEDAIKMFDKIPPTDPAELFPIYNEFSGETQVSRAADESGARRLSLSRNSSVKMDIINEDIEQVKEEQIFAAAPVVHGQSCNQILDMKISPISEIHEEGCHLEDVGKAFSSPVIAIHEKIKSGDIRHSATVEKRESQVYSTNDFEVTYDEAMSIDSSSNDLTHVGSGVIECDSNNNVFVEIKEEKQLPELVDHLSYAIDALSHMFNEMPFVQNEFESEPEENIYIESEKDNTEKAGKVRDGNNVRAGVDTKPEIKDYQWSYSVSEIWEHDVIEPEPESGYSDLTLVKNDDEEPHCIEAETKLNAELLQSQHISPNKGGELESDATAKEIAPNEKSDAPFMSLHIQEGSWSSDTIHVEPEICATNATTAETSPLPETFRMDHNLDLQDLEKSLEHQIIVDEEEQPPRVDDQMEPPRVDDQMEPPRVDDQMEPPRVGDQMEPPGVGDQMEPPRVDDQMEPPRVDDQMEPPRVDDQMEPPRVCDQMEPPRVDDQMEPPRVGDQMEPPRVDDQMEPPRVGDQMEPPRVDDQMEPPTVDDQMEPPRVNDQMEPTTEDDQMEPPRVDEKMQSTIVNKKSVPTGVTYHMEPPRKSKNKLQNLLRKYSGPFSDVEKPLSADTKLVSSITQIYSGDKADQATSLDTQHIASITQVYTETQEDKLHNAGKQAKHRSKFHFSKIWKRKRGGQE